MTEDTPTGGPPVTTYHSSPDAFYVNSHIVRLPGGLAVVDTQFVLPEAEALAQVVREAGQPLLAVLLTHPHPDHVNGTGVLRRDWPGVPVYATRATAEGMAELAAPKRAQWKPILGDAYPDEVVPPDCVVASGEEVEVGGARFRLTDLGALESINQSLIALPERRVLFAGDLFYNRVHPWLIEGRAARWREALAGLESEMSAYDRIYVGHGGPGDVGAARAQVDYMDFVFGLVRGALGTSDTAASREAINAAVRERYPDWPLDGLIAMNTDALLQEFSSDRH